MQRWVVKPKSGVRVARANAPSEATDGSDTTRENKSAVSYSQTTAGNSTAYSDSGDSGVSSYEGAVQPSAGTPQLSRKMQPRPPPVPPKPKASASSSNASTSFFSDSATTTALNFSDKTPTVTPISSDEVPYSDESVSSIKKHAAAAHATALPVGAASYYYTLDNNGAAIPNTGTCRVAWQNSGSLDQAANGLRRLGIRTVPLEQESQPRRVLEAANADLVDDVISTAIDANETDCFYKVFKRLPPTYDDALEVIREMRRRQINKQSNGSSQTRANNDSPLLAPAMHVNTLPREQKITTPSKRRQKSVQFVDEAPGSSTDSDIVPVHRSRSEHQLPRRAVKSALRKKQQQGQIVAVPLGNMQPSRRSQSHSRLHDTQQVIFDTDDIADLSEFRRMHDRDKAPSLYEYRDEQARNVPQVQVDFLGIDVFGTHVVRLERPDQRPYGFFIAPGMTRKKKKQGVFISRVSLPALNRVMSVGDELLAVNGKAVRGRSVQEVQQWIGASNVCVIALSPIV